MSGGNRVTSNSQQFDLQLEIEGLTRDQLKDHGVTLRARTDHLFGDDRDRRFGIALRVLLALKRVPGFEPGEAEDRFAAWCQGFGISADDCFGEFAKMVQRRREPTRTKDGT